LDHVRCNVVGPTQVADCVVIGHDDSAKRLTEAPVFD
jgi:hypothetical protein